MILRLIYCCSGQKFVYKVPSFRATFKLTLTLLANTDTGECGDLVFMWKSFAKETYKKIRLGPKLKDIDELKGIFNKALSLYRNKQITRQNQIR